MPKQLTRVQQVRKFRKLPLSDRATLVACGIFSHNELRVPCPACKADENGLRLITYTVPFVEGKFKMLACPACHRTWQTTAPDNRHTRQF